MQTNVNVARQSSKAMELSQQGGGGVKSTNKIAETKKQGCVVARRSGAELGTADGGHSKY